MAKKRTIAAAKFKAECLALFNRVSECRETYVVTKHGRPVAQIVPFGEAVVKPLRGSVKVRGDIVAPVLEDWDIDR